jgi:hypothetical protein
MGAGGRASTIGRAWCPAVFSLSKPRAISYNVLTFGRALRLSLCKARLVHL